MSAVPTSISPTRRGAHSQLMLRVSIALVAVTGIVLIARSGVYDAASPLGYWMGVVGGSLMLLLLLYPLSKRAQALRNAMPVRYWFAMHMAMGVVGPALVLLHCTLRIGSLNAAVAFWSMVVVASSGFIGRFVYGRLHAGLYGRQRDFSEVSRAAEAMLAQATARLSQAPRLLAELRAFAEHAAKVSAGGLRHPLALLALGSKARRAASRCRALLVDGRTGAAASAGSAAAILESVDRYLGAARDAAQFRAFERVFALWHVLHIPLVLILLVSAVVHVIAVHMY
jgi:hypothetical protein